MRINPSKLFWGVLSSCLLFLYKISPLYAKAECEYTIIRSYQVSVGTTIDLAECSKAAATECGEPIWTNSKPYFLNNFSVSTTGSSFCDKGQYVYSCFDINRRPVTNPTSYAECDPYDPQVVCSICPSYLGTNPTYVPGISSGDIYDHDSIVGNKYCYCSHTNLNGEEYYNHYIFVAQVTKCPSLPGTVQKITDCHIPKNATYMDTTGSYTMIPSCFYKE